MWRARQDSNLRPSAPEADALSTELQARGYHGEEHRTGHQGQGRGRPEVRAVLNVVAPHRSVGSASADYDHIVIGRDQLLRRALALSVLSIAINGVAGGTAVAVGLTSGSLSLLGFGFDAAVDSAASVVLVWRFGIEARAPDRADRVEKVAERAIGVVLLVLATYLAIGAVRALASGSHPESTALGWVLLVVSLAVLPPLALAKYRVAAKLPSRALRADSLLTGAAAVLALISLWASACPKLSASRGRMPSAPCWSRRSW